MSPRYSLIAFLIAAAIQPAECITHPVHGVVIDSVTGAGVPSVTITLEGQNSYRASTEKDGNFRIEAVAEGEYRVTFEVAGYVSPDLQKRLTQAFRVSGVPSRLDATLVPAGEVAGRVLDPRGKPVAGSEVTLDVAGEIIPRTVTTEPVGGVGAALALAESSASQRVTTGADGTFNFSGISPGSYRLHAIPPSSLRPPDPAGNQSMGWVRTSFPASLAILAGSRLPGQDIHLRPVPVYKVRGVVTSQAGAPSPGIPLTLAPDDEIHPREMRAVTKADGSFTFPTVPNGGWRLSASSKNPKLKAFKWVHVTGHDPDRIALKLSSSFTVHGTIEVPGNPESPGGCVVLAPEEGGDDSLQSCGGTRDFTIANVFHRNYWIQPLAFPTFRANDYYLSSITIGQRDAMGQAIELSATSPPIHIVYREGGGALQGSVPNCGLATVIAIPREAALRQNMNYRLIRRTSCKEDGSFRIPNMRPGNYYVFALDKYRPQPNEFNELPQSLIDKAASVTVGDGESKNIDLKVIGR